MSLAVALILRLNTLYAGLRKLFKRLETCVYQVKTKIAAITEIIANSGFKQRFNFDWGIMIMNHHQDIKKLNLPDQNVFT